MWGFVCAGLGALLVHQALPGDQDNPGLRPARSWLAATPWPTPPGSASPAASRCPPLRCPPRPVARGPGDVQGPGDRQTPPAALRSGCGCRSASARGGWGWPRSSRPSTWPSTWGGTHRPPTPWPGDGRPGGYGGGGGPRRRPPPRPLAGRPVVAALVGIAVKGERQEEPGASKVVGRVAAGLAAAGAAWLVPRIVGWLRGAEPRRGSARRRDSGHEEAGEAAPSPASDRVGAASAVRVSYPGKSWTRSSVVSAGRSLPVERGGHDVAVEGESEVDQDHVPGLGRADICRPS